MAINGGALKICGNCTNSVVSGLTLNFSHGDLRLDPYDAGASVDGNLRTQGLSQAVQTFEDTAANFCVCRYYGL